MEIKLKVKVFSLQFFIDKIFIGTSPSPLKIKRSRLIRKYLQSPKAKALFKDGHCTFCSVIAEGCDLETHLTNSPNCKKYYLRNFKVKEVLPILVKEFNCLFCKVGGNIRINNHIQKSERCRNLYFEKFQTRSLDVLKSKLNQLRRQTMPSNVNRKLELSNRRSKREEEKQSRTETDLLNSFRRETTFANCLHCCKCGANFCFGSRRIEEVKLGENNNEEYQTVEMLGKRRFQKFYLCKFCKDQVKDPVLREPPIKITRRGAGDDKVVFALYNDEDVDASSQNVIGQSTAISCLLPCTLECLKYLDCSNIKSRDKDVGNMFNIDADLDNLIGIIHEHELNKYKQLQHMGDRYEGVIGDLGSKTLLRAEKVYNDSALSGSESFRRIQSSNLLPRVKQLGSLCVYISISVPLDSKDVMATTQVQMGNIITVEYVGNSSNEYESNYYVHVNHDTETDCSDNCTKVPLNDYLQQFPVESNMLKTKFLSAYVTSVQSKVNAVIRNFIKAPSSSLHSEEYYLQLFFNSDGTIDIRGLAWLKSMENLNLKFAKYPTLSLDRDLVKDLERHIDSTLCATSDPVTLSKKLNVSEAEAKEISDLVSLYQFHFCGRNKQCLNCKQPILPLLKTLLVEYSPFNLQMSVKLIDFVKQKLINLEDGDVLAKKTEDWLLEIFDSNNAKIDQINNVSIDFKLNDEDFHFQMDERLEDLNQYFQRLYPDFQNVPVLSCYHYSVTTARMPHAGSVILERVKLKDSYTSDCSLLLLKAFKSKAYVVALNANCGILEDMKTFCDMDHIDNLKPGVAETYREVSLTEAFCLFDKNFFQTFSSNHVQFVYAIEDRKKFFKPVSRETDNSFHMEGSKKMFVQQLSGLERFFLMEKNERNIVAAEFIQNFEFVGESESKNFVKLFEKVSIEDSDIQTAFSSEIFLPEFIILVNGDVMQLRKSKKILTFPDFEKNSPQFQYRQVLLFSPEAEEIMDNEKVLSLFQRLDDPPACDERGRGITMIQRVER